MSYQVLARKYRPQRFREVVGQEHVTQTLSNAITQNRIAHAYLFCGPRGTGKTTVARIFAKCLNATGGPTVDFDDADPRCIEITEGRAIDVLEIDGASNNGVEQVRELRDTVKYAPASSRFKVYIIDEVHMLSAAAFNALLKTLEEPPAHVKFLFATTDPEKVLPTILSRCQRFDLRRIPIALIVQHLSAIAAQEAVKVEEAALFAIARGADGGMRDAESTLDQLISFCGNEIVEADVLSMFGLAAGGQIIGLAEALIGGEPGVALSLLDELARHGKDLGRLLADLLGHFRNLLVYRVSGGDRRLLEISETEAAALESQAARLETDALTRMLEVLTDAEGRLRDAVSRKILLEVTLLRTIQAREQVSLDAVLKQLRHLRDEAASVPAAAFPPAGRSVPAPTAPATLADAPPPASDPLPNEAPAGRAIVALGDLPTLWTQLLEAIGRVSQFSRSYFVKAFPVSLDARVLTIGFDAEFASYLTLVDNPKNHTLIQTKLKELGVGDRAIRFTVIDRPAAVAPAGPNPAPVAKPRPAPASSAAVPAPAAGSADSGKGMKGKPVKLDPATFKNDPLIQQALEVFRGQIVEVRG